MTLLDKTTYWLGVFTLCAIPAAWGLIQCIKGPGAAGIADAVWAWVIWPAMYVLSVSVAYQVGKRS